MIDAIREWWEEHRTDAKWSKTMLHRFPFQFIILSCLVTFSVTFACTKERNRCMVSAPVVDAVRLNPPPQRIMYSSLLGPVTASMHRVLAGYPRTDGVSYFVPFENRGMTELIDIQLNKPIKKIGYVYNDPTNFSTIIQIGNVRVGVKPTGTTYE